MEEEKSDEELKQSKIKRLYLKHRDLLFEIFRFLLVGGLATLVDWAICYFTSLVFPEIKLGNWSIDKALSTTCGFVCGLIINYVLSIFFVYRNKKDEKEGKSFKDFVIFTIIGVFTLLISYLGIYLMYDILSLPYMVARVIMTLIGLVINYLGRKILIFK